MQFINNYYLILLKLEQTLQYSEWYKNCIQEIFQFFPIVRNAMKILFETTQETGPEIAALKTGTNFAVAMIMPF